MLWWLCLAAADFHSIRLTVAPRSLNLTSNSEVLRLTQLMYKSCLHCIIIIIMIRALIKSQFPERYWYDSVLWI